MKRFPLYLFAAVALLCAAAPAPALADDKPLIIRSGVTRQQPADSTLAIDSSLRIENAGTPTMIDLRAANTDTKGGTYCASSNTFSYYPIVGWQVGDFQRAQCLVRFKSAYNVIKAETGLAIDTYVNTGSAPSYATSTAYTAGQYVVVPSANYIYQVASNCTSGGSAPVWPSSGSVANGTCTFTWAAYGQQNAKMPLFVQTVADAGAGNTWSGVFNTIYKSGYRGQFGASVEIDVTNNSGIDQPNHSGIFLASGGGSNKIQNALTIFGAAVGQNFVDGIAIGATAASQSDIHSFSSAAYGLLDNGSHTNGILLNGTYSGPALYAAGAGTFTGALTAGSPITASADNGQVRLLTANGRGWRIGHTSTGTTHGYLYLQGTTDNFATSFIDGLFISTAGNTGLGNSAPVAGARATITGQVSDTDATSIDQGQVFITDSDNSLTSGLMVGYRFQAGVAEYGRIQARNSVGATSLYLNAAGGTVLIGPGGAQISAKTVATLPTCNAGAAGTVLYVTDANAPTWNATLAGGGAVKTLAMCNGTNWTAH